MTSGKARGRGVGPWHWAGVAALVLLAAHAVRVAAVEAWTERRPELAARVWPGHPKPLLAMALTGIGAAAGEGRAPDRRLLAEVDRAARRAPLAPEPLLVAAADRLSRGEGAQGEKLLQAALRRDPRSTAAQFLLADFYLRQGRTGQALTALVALDRQVGGVTTSFAPALAQSLRNPGTAATLAPILGRNPPLRNAVMGRLASDPAAGGSMLVLIRKGDRAEPWARAAIDRLIETGNALAARALATRLGTRLDALAAFDAPLGWYLPPVAGGAAERLSPARLRLVSYGREEAVLAEHALLLPPGRYRLSGQMTGSDPSAFAWRLRCFGGATPIDSMASVGDPVFSIGTDCPTQKLQLIATVGETARTTSTDLGTVVLRRIADGAPR